MPLALVELLGLVAAEDPHDGGLGFRSRSTSRAPIVPEPPVTSTWRPRSIPMASMISPPVVVGPGLRGVPPDRRIVA